MRSPYLEGCGVDKAYPRCHRIGLWVEKKVRVNSTIGRHSKPSTPPVKAILHIRADSSIGRDTP